VNQFQPTGNGNSGSRNSGSGWNDPKKRAAFNRIRTTLGLIFRKLPLARLSTSHHHRRGLEDDEELLQRDFEAEELFGREYDDFLVERDAFDDLD
jgi:hypothetical protein